MRKILVLLVLLTMFCVGVAFSYHNPQAVEVNYLAGQLQAPLGTLLMGAVSLSAVLVAVLAWLLALPRRAELASLRRRLERADKELDRLRNLPLKHGDS